MTKKSSKPFDKTEVIAAIQELLQSNTVKTQDEICDVLNKRGMDVNQSKISRILHKLGAIKLMEDNKTVYRLPIEIMTVTPKNAVLQLILHIAHNNNVVVIQTTPGSAQLVARILDQQKPDGVLGTVAGDDTIFVAPKIDIKCADLCQKITKILLG